MFAHTVLMTKLPVSSTRVRAKSYAACRKGCNQQPSALAYVALAGLATACGPDLHQTVRTRATGETVSHAPVADYHSVGRAVGLVATIRAEKTGVRVFAQRCERRLRCPLVGV